MIHCKLIAKKAVILLLFVSVFAVAKVSAQDGIVLDGKALFNTNCASCHGVFIALIGPALAGVEDRGPWKDREKLYEFIKNPAAFMAKDAYAKELDDQYPTQMIGLPHLTKPEIDSIVSYINTQAAVPKDTVVTIGEEVIDTSGRNAIIFGVIAILLALVVLVLMRVNSTLKKMSDDKEGIQHPDPVPFYRNKTYIALLTIVLFIIGGLLVVQGAIGLGRQKDYQPVQPIYFSHKVHAGINQISCMYCHGGAMDGKLAGFPSVSSCMGCHKAIQEYTLGPKLYDEEGNEIDGTAEIAKLFKYAGFDPKNPAAWDPSMAKAIEWIRIHNLPDHVYFNHSQHVHPGNVQCQTCHGEITAMHEVKQVSELSMSWCINCHRESTVNFQGNKFYSIYEKFHNDIKSGKIDSVTVSDMGGISCQKCHY